MFKRALHNQPTASASAEDIAEIARQLFACAAEAGNSEHKRAHFIRLPEIVLAQAAAIAQGRYAPQPFTVFAVTDPKLREIFAPAFAEAPEEFFVPPYKIEEISYSKLLRQALANKVSNRESLVEFHRRFSYAFLGIPLLLLGLPVLLAVHKNKGRDLALAIPVSCGLAFAAWGGWSASQSLAKTATLPPGIASWSIHLLTIGLGCFLLKKYNQ